MSILALQAFFRRIDNSNKFQFVVIAVIVLSALSIGAHTYRLPAWINNTLLILDYSITVFFLLEIIIRFLASPSPGAFFKKGWNIFDTLIVLGSLVPIGGSTILLARLLRIFRVLRLISVVPELRILINALLKAIPRMAYIALLMFIIFYIYATVGSIVFVNINPELWGDVGIALLTMFRIATFESWGAIMGEVMTVYPLSWTFFISFIFLATFIFLNMMVGTILDVMAKETRNVERETTTKDQMVATVQDIDALKAEILELKALLIQKNQH
ncbi:ion transporter [Zophobihabitans entericus]|uniref:Ion transporter n=1 Tax=Zophobihabitans entericus TaxID=1635327 RepID=A0A6G9IB93_9GAMM|nr:ion transporter [Zophobihabitans entericus]QIQ21505.1 ion transporter [Zophobihabitans entericus]